MKSKDGDKTLGGPYDTRAEAEKRLGQIEYFKRNDSQHRETLARIMGARSLGDGAAEMGTDEMMREALRRDGLELDGESPAYVAERFHQRAVEAARLDAAEAHMFTHCMTSIAPGKDISDPEAFCAWLTHEVTGLWPAQGG